jgi:ethanolamine ammonia-lyase small subunit
MDNDAWHILKNFTHARIALGRAGDAQPTNEILQFRMAHALAKDAVHSEIDILSLSECIQDMGLQSLTVKSSITDSNEYLKNPNKGRILDNQSIKTLQKSTQINSDVCIILADGLSANAVNNNSIPLLKQLIPKLENLSLAPIIIAKYGRVALSDHIGELLHSRITLLLIGERPGLSSSNSLGAYITYIPKTGNTDEKRNCISNIQPEGLPYEFAAVKVAYLLNEMLIKQISGVGLKDNFTDNRLV